MRRRRNAEQSDSLELLLDTICNTFGGIVFMAILISLLTTDSARSVVDPEGISGFKLQKLDAEELLQAAQADAKSADATVLAMAASMNLDAQSIVAVLEPARAAVLDAPDDLLGQQIVQTDQQIAHANENLAQAEEDLAKSEQQLAKAEADARAAMLMARRPLRMPRSRETEKQQAIIYVSENRMWYGLYTDVNMKDAPLFQSAILTLDERIGPDNLRRVSPGVAIKSAKAASDTLIPLLARTDRETVYLAFAVWEDSHDAYRFLRDEALSHGFGYTVFLMGEQGRIGFGGSSVQEQ